MSMEWIAVTDRLPSPAGSYWVTTVEGMVHLGFMNEEGTAFRRKGVVAWMPCPPTPEPARFTIRVNAESSPTVSETTETSQPNPATGIELPVSSTDFEDEAVRRAGQ